MIHSTIIGGQTGLVEKQAFEKSFVGGYRRRYFHSICQGVCEGWCEVEYRESQDCCQGKVEEQSVLLLELHV